MSYIPDVEDMNKMRGVSSKPITELVESRNDDKDLVRVYTRYGYFKVFEDNDLCFSGDAIDRFYDYDLDHALDLGESMSIWPENVKDTYHELDEAGVRKMFDWVFEKKKYGDMADLLEDHALYLGITATGKHVFIH